MLYANHIALINIVRGVPTLYTAMSSFKIKKMNKNDVKIIRIVCGK